MEAVETVVVGAILVEAVVAAIKPIWDDNKRKLSWSMIASLLVGIMISLAANLDIVKIVGVSIDWPMVSQIITGVIISRGANYVHSFVRRLGSVRDDGN